MRPPVCLRRNVVRVAAKAAAMQLPLVVVAKLLRVARVVEVLSPADVPMLVAVVVARRW